MSEYVVQYDTEDFFFTKETFSKAVAPYCQFYKNCNKTYSQVSNPWQAKMFGNLFTQNNMLIHSNKKACTKYQIAYKDAF